MTDYTTETFRAGSAATIGAAERTEEAAQDTARISPPYYSGSADMMRTFCLKLIDMTEANTRAAFDFTRQLVLARGPAEIVDSCTEHANKLFALFSAQANELAAQAQEISERPEDMHSVH